MRVFFQAKLQSYKNGQLVSFKNNPGGILTIMCHERHQRSAIRLCICEHG